MNIRKHHTSTSSCQTAPHFVTHVWRLFSKKTRTTIRKKQHMCNALVSKTTTKIHSNYEIQACPKQTSQPRTHQPTDHGSYVAVNPHRLSASKESKKWNLSRIGKLWDAQGGWGGVQEFICFPNIPDENVGFSGTPPPLGLPFFR